MSKIMIQYIAKVEAADGIISEISISAVNAIVARIYAHRLGYIVHAVEEKS